MDQTLARMGAQTGKMIQKLESMGNSTAFERLKAGSEAYKQKVRELNAAQERTKRALHGVTLESEIMANRSRAAYLEMKASSQEYVASVKAAEAAQRKLSAAMSPAQVETKKVSTGLSSLGNMALVSGLNVSSLVGHVTNLGRAFVSAAMEGEKLSALRGGFAKLGGNAAMLNKLRSATQGLVPDTTLVRVHNLAESFGIGTQNLDQFSKIALGASKLLGTSVEKNLEDLFTGLSRGSKMIIDNLGISMRSAAIYEAEYAGKHGLAVDKLTEDQKKLAFQYEVVRGASKQTAAAEMDGLDGLTKLSVQYENIKDKVAIFAAEILNRLIPALEKVTGAFEPLIVAIENYAAKIDSAVGSMEGLGGLGPVVDILGTASAGFLDAGSAASNLEIALWPLGEGFGIVEAKANTSTAAIEKFAESMGFVSKEQKEKSDAARRAAMEEEQQWTQNYGTQQKLLRSLGRIHGEVNQTVKDGVWDLKMMRKGWDDNLKAADKAAKAGKQAAAEAARALQEELKLRRALIEAIEGQSRALSDQFVSLQEVLFLGKDAAGFAGREGGLAAMFGMGPNARSEIDLSREQIAKMRSDLEEYGTAGDRLGAMTKTILSQFHDASGAVGELGDKVKTKIAGRALADMRKFGEAGIQMSTQLGEGLFRAISGATSFREEMFGIMGELLGKLASAFAAWALTEQALLSGNFVLGIVGAAALGAAAAAISAYGSRDTGGAASAASAAPRNDSRLSDRQQSGPQVVIEYRGLVTPDKEDIKRIGKLQDQYGRIGGRWG